MPRKKLAPVDAPDPEYADDVSEFGPSPGQAMNIAALVKKERELTSRQKKAEDQLTKINDALQLIRTRTLPDAMLEANMQEFKLRDGRKIELTTDTYASMSAENAPAGIKWLTANGHDGILKTEVNANLGKAALTVGAVIEVLLKHGFGPGAKKAVPKLTELLQSRTNETLNPADIEHLLLEGLGMNAVVTNKTGVHAKTLASFVKEQLDAGTKLPAAIKWTQIRVAKIREPKANKKGSL